MGKIDDTYTCIIYRHQARLGLGRIDLNTTPKRFVKRRVGSFTETEFLNF